MADGTSIEWADATVNAINGCSVHSPGCTHCYAMKLAGTRMKNHPTRQGLTIETKAGPVWNGEVRLHEPALLQPLSWTEPRRIFWNAHGDTFHENVPDEWIDRIFAVAALTPQHTHMILTKRSARMRDYLSSPRASRRIARGIIDMLINKQAKYDEQTWPVISEGDVDAPSDVLIRWPLPNVWLGVSVEDQTRADERIPDLLATPAAVRFLSCEPLLGPVDINRWLHIMWRCSYCRQFFDGRHKQHCPGCGKEGGYCGSHPFNGRNRPARPGFPFQSGSGIDWIIAGGESGPGARPMHPDWARSLRDQCAAAGVPFHFKQWGEWGHAFHLNGCHGISAATTGTGHWPDPKRYRVVGGPLDGERFESHPSDYMLLRTGKKRAGRLLDGVEHNGMPEVRA
ncbi:MAG: phage Gp37/Gp68 family protein [Novosphingobium sp.]